MTPSFLEFFAGGGMARAGLTPEWRCLLANDIDAKKGSIYRANWGDAEFLLADIGSLKPDDLPAADMAWASFPCQDLSLAGYGRGLNGERSGLFRTLCALLHGLRRRPRLLVLENVGGTLTSRGGGDFREICRALASLNYVFGAVVVDASHFLPQSRPRLFMIAAHSHEALPTDLTAETAVTPWAPAALLKQVESLPADLRKAWVWWRLPQPPERNTALADLILDEPTDVQWHDAATTGRLLGMMSDVNRAKVEAAKAFGLRSVGALYRRTRVENGEKIQRAEVRFDDVAGCLRTPGGGSSRQTIIVVEHERVRSRLLSKHEAAALMGYEGVLPENYNDAYHLLGDGLAVPVVRHLSRHLLLPLALRAARSIAA